MFAVTDGIQIATGQSSSVFSIVGTVVPGSEQIITTPLAPGPSPASAFAPPGWLFPIFIVLGIFVLLLVGFVITNSVTRRRAHHPGKVLTRGAEEEPPAPEMKK